MVELKGLSGPSSENAHSIHIYREHPASRLAWRVWGNSKCQTSPAASWNRLVRPLTMYVCTVCRPRRSAKFNRGPCTQQGAAISLWKPGHDVPVCTNETRAHPCSQKDQGKYQQDDGLRMYTIIREHLLPHSNIGHSKVIQSVIMPPCVTAIRTPDLLSTVIILLELLLLAAQRRCRVSVLCRYCPYNDRRGAH